MSIPYAYQMTQLYCACLNVKISTKQELLDADFILRNDVQDLNHDFFRRKLCSVDDTEVHMEHSYMVHKKNVDDWVVHQCLNCGIQTHATYHKPQSALISSLLERDPLVVERLKQSADYSKAFHIVLHVQDLLKGNNSSPNLPGGSTSENYESLQSTLSVIQSHLSDYLIQEENAMEERISQYEEEQRKQLQQLQNRAQLEKKKLFHLLLHAEKSDSTSSEDQMSDYRHRHTPSPAKNALSRTKSTPERASIPHRGFEEEDAMFMLDDDEPIDQPFLVSDDDEDEDTNSDASPIPYPSAAHRKPKLNYSSSVPICVPKWDSIATRENLDLDEEEPLPGELEDIASSMQALARSIANDEREVFGGRPRPRMNTGDFKR